MKQADAAKSQVKVAEAALGLAKSGRTNVEISGSNERSSEGLSAEADAGLSSAQAGEQQVALRQKQIATTRAQVDQARAARDQAKVRLRYCFLFAPCDGYVVKRMVNVGTAINPGQTIVTITRGAEVWVVANFKETQIGTIREGQPVDFDVDAFPGQVFHGKVLEIMRATGSATTLIPPDNSTGNFTKVVQRVPIKLSIEPDRAGSASVLRQGMSVSASIETGSNGGSK
jgi:membrane fusion protein (multidrug efflux system)